MGAKKTSELIPFCHPISLDDCQVDIRFDEPDRPNEVGLLPCQPLPNDDDDDRHENIHPNIQVLIDCTVKVQSKTGVEMEAMTGASVAALCIYDMCKATSHDILIKVSAFLSHTYTSCQENVAQ